MGAVLAGAALSAFSSGLNNLLARDNAKEAFGRQKELMALQQKYAVENWAREANYNTPQAQMQRLKEAGLNPNLIYGNGASGLQGPSVAAPTAPSAPMSATVPMGNPVTDAAQAALAMKQAKLAGSKATEQDIRNRYVAQEVEATLRNLDSQTQVNQEQKKAIIQSVTASQAEVDALKTRVGNEKFDRILAFMQTVGQLDYWENQKGLNDEQKKWLGTHALAALIGAQGAAAQAHAMADAIRLFRDPKKLKKLIDGYKDLIAEELKKDHNIPLLKEFEDIKDDIANGDWLDALFGRKLMGHFRKWLMGDNYDGVK